MSRKTEGIADGTMGGFSRFAIRTTIISLPALVRFHGTRTTTVILILTSVRFKTNGTGLAVEPIQPRDGRTRTRSAIIAAFVVVLEICRAAARIWRWRLQTRRHRRHSGRFRLHFWHPREGPTTIAYFRLDSKMELIDRPHEFLPEIGGKFEIDLPQRGRKQRVRGTGKGTACFHTHIRSLKAVLEAIGAYQLVVSGAVLLGLDVRKGRGHGLVKGNADVSISIVD